MSPAPRMLLRTQSDRRLADLARAGAEPAFEALVERHRRALLRHCERMVGESRAQDAVQQACLAAWRALRRGVEVREPRAWLLAIAHREALRLLSETAAMTVADLESVPAQGGGEPGEDRRRLRETFAAIGALPDNQREALVLTELEGRSRAEVASLLGVTDGAVRQLVHRARAGVRSAVTAVTPMGLMLRLAGGPGTSRERIVELAAGGGGAGAAAAIVKVGAVVAVVGTATGLSGLGGHRRPEPAEAKRPAREARAAHPSAATPAAGAPTAHESASAPAAQGHTRPARTTAGRARRHRKTVVRWAGGGSSGGAGGSSHTTQTAVVVAPTVHRVAQHTSSDGYHDTSSEDTSSADTSTDDTGSDPSTDDTSTDDASYDDSSSGESGSDPSADDSSSDDPSSDGGGYDDSSSGDGSDDPSSDGR